MLETMPWRQSKYEAGLEQRSTTYTSASCPLKSRLKSVADDLSGFLVKYLIYPSHTRTLAMVLIRPGLPN
jgi:hypothetical protein